MCQTFNPNISAAFRRYLAEAAKTFELKDSLPSVKKLDIISNVSLAREIITGFYAKSACHTSIGVSASWGTEVLLMATSGLA